jgi:ketosteroid isomerase-like protein
VIQSVEEVEMKIKMITMILLAVMIMLPTALYAQDTDPESVAGALLEALMAKDVDAAMALVADDAVVTVIPPPTGTSGVFTGKEEIRTWYEQLVAWNFRAEFSNFQVDGDTATWTTTAWADPFEPLGILPLEYHAEGVFQDDKVVSYTDTMTEESVTKLTAAMAALPVTGGSMPSGTPLLWFGAGGLLLIAGLGLRRGARRAR